MFRQEPHPDRLALILYALCTSLLLAHEVDSGIWREWELFHVPGPGLFAWVHVPITMAASVGAYMLAKGYRAGHWAGFVLALTGIGAGIIHGSFWIAGSTAFLTISSVTLLAAFFAAGLALGFVSLRHLNRPILDGSSVVVEWVKRDGV
jgi:hypothetical protein